MLNFTHLQGNTFDASPFRILKDGFPFNLSDAEIKMQLRRESGGVVYLELKNGKGITITNAENGEFQIDEQIIDIEGGDYLYDIKIVKDTARTWIKGTFKIESKITE